MQPLWKSNFWIRMVTELLMTTKVLLVLKSSWWSMDHSTVGSDGSALSTHLHGRSISVLSFQCIHRGGLAGEAFLPFTSTQNSFSILCSTVFVRKFRIMKSIMCLQQNEEIVRSLLYSGSLQKATEYLNCSAIPLWPFFFPSSAFLIQQVIPRKCIILKSQSKKKLLDIILGKNWGIFIFSDRNLRHKNDSQSADSQNLKERFTIYLNFCSI